MMDLDPDFRSLAAAFPQDGPYVDIRPLVSALESRGWSAERLMKNELDSACREEDDRYPRFVATIAVLDDELRSLGIEPVFIKCFRTYRYSDANIDVLVPRSQLRSVARHLYGSAWRAPEPWDQFEQLLIERAKLKLPSAEAGLLTAHLYGGVSWRYQSDIGLLRRDGERPDPAHLRRVGLARYGEGVDPAKEVWIPDGAAELVLQAAHVAFENYRITVGEALNFQLLKLRDPDAWADAVELAPRYGCVRALEMMDRESDWICDHLGDLDPRDYPRTLEAPSVLRPVAERTRTLLRGGRYLSALNELGTSVAVYSLVRGIRRIRRLRRGMEDYR